MTRTGWTPWHKVEQIRDDLTVLKGVETGGKSRS